MGVNRVDFGTKTIIDISDSTVTADKLAAGEIAYGADGERVVGTADITNASGLPVIVWENASPASKFAAKTISIDLSSFSWIVVEYRFSVDYDNRNTVFVPTNDNCVYNMNVVGASNNRTGARGFTVTDSGVTFNAAKYNEKENNEYAIPTRIWGIAGGAM